MLFSSPPFFVFFVCYFLVHLMAPKRLRLPLILIGSTIFYGYWNPLYAPFPYLLLGIAAAGTWWLAKAEGATRRWRLGLTIASLLLPLAFFKYANFFWCDVLGLVCPTTSKLVEVSLPLGISFVTFTLIGYAVDVYRCKVPVENRLPTLAGAVMFFPHLIAGPVVLPRQLIWQLDPPQPAIRSHYLSAVLVFTVGLVKKLVIADQLALVVNPVFNLNQAWTGADYLLAMLGFSAQIYCDFSGYSDMAVGLAMLLGVQLPKNFDRPYSATSVVDFWNRWHITLSHWLRDYLYIPLGGNRHGFGKQMRNVLITMCLGGLWHGARWTFVLWGLVHGCAIVLTHLYNRYRKRSGKKSAAGKDKHAVWWTWVQITATFLFITFTWVTFRAQNLETMWRVLSGPFVAPWPDLAQFASTRTFPLILLPVFLLTHRFDNLALIWRLDRRVAAEFLWAAVAVLWLLAIAVSAGNSAEFIYFDF